MGLMPRVPRAGWWPGADSGPTTEGWKDPGVRVSPGSHFRGTAPGRRVPAPRAEPPDIPVGLMVGFWGKILPIPPTSSRSEPRWVTAVTAPGEEPGDTDATDSSGRRRVAGAVVESRRGNTEGNQTEWPKSRINKP